VERVLAFEQDGKGGMELYLQTFLLFFSLKMYISLSLSFLYIVTRSPVNMNLVKSMNASFLTPKAVMHGFRRRHRSDLLFPCVTVSFDSFDGVTEVKSS
jgi:hypothetical protein